VEYIPETDRKNPIRDFKGMALKYLQGGFMTDFIPLIPLQFVPFTRVFEIKNTGNIFYLIKLVRLARGLELLNV